MKTERFQGKVVIVTGAAQGIGRAIAERFGSESAQVVAVDINGEVLTQTVTELREPGYEIHSVVGDVGCKADAERSVAEALAMFGHIDVLVNNAGIGQSTSLLDITEGEWDRVLDTNLKGQFLMSQQVARYMVDAGGGVMINMSSTGGIASEPGHVHYGASKAGVILLTKGMALDLAPYNIRVCAVAPGQVATKPWGNVEWSRIYEDKIPMKRSACPEEIAAVFAFLASEDASYVTGSTFIVDGGLLAWE